MIVEREMDNEYNTCDLKKEIMMYGIRLRDSTSALCLNSSPSFCSRSIINNNLHNIES